jgi:hypothetical protein
MRWMILVAALAMAACSPPAANKAADPEAQKIAATPPPAESIACKADHDLECTAAGCQSNPNDYAQIHFDIDPEGRGQLCAPDCLPFLLQPAAGGGDKRSGWALTSAAGMAPAADFLVSIAPDDKTFVLTRVSGGRLKGWAGACEPKP